MYVEIKPVVEESHLDTAASPPPMYFDVVSDFAVVQEQLGMVELPMPSLDETGQTRTTTSLGGRPQETNSGFTAQNGGRPL